MAFDGIITRAMANELNERLAGGKIEKIYQPEAEELVFHIHTHQGRHKLYLSCRSDHACIHIADETPENPAVPPRFCMLLRKHIQSGRITGVRQKDCERIIEIDFETPDEMNFSVNKKLIVEIMGKHSNIILITPESNRILDSVKRLSTDVNRARQILPGNLYKYPPSQDKIPFADITRNEFYAICTSKSTVRSDTEIKSLAKKIIDNIQGISPVIARQIAAADDMFGELSSICKILDNAQTTAVVYEKKTKAPVDFHVIDIAEYKDAYDALYFDTISKATEYFLKNRTSSNRLNQKKAFLQKSVRNSLKKLLLKKKRLGEDMIKAENSNIYRLYGELITANIHKIKTGDNEAVLTNYYDGQLIHIPLDIRYAPAKNAQLYFKKYGKAKTALKEKKLQMDSNDRDISYLESVSVYIDNAASNDDLDALRTELIDADFIRRRKSKNPEKKMMLKPYEYMTTDGFRVCAGRNNKGNDILTFKTAGPKDLWFHTKDIPGAHVTLFTEGQEVTEKAVFEAASIAAYHSRARESENVPVDFTLIKHVKKPAGARPGMVIFTDNKTVYVDPRAYISGIEKF